MKILVLVRQWVNRLKEWAVSKNIRPFPFLVVYFVTLMLFPFALGWVGVGVSEGARVQQLLPRVILAWALLQAPSLYVLLLGRDVPKALIIVIVLFVIIISGRYFAWIGVALAVVVLILLCLLRRLFSRRRYKQCENLLKKDRTMPSMKS